jgi:hypothetical protein
LTVRRTDGSSRWYSRPKGIRSPASYPHRRRPLCAKIRAAAVLIRAPGLKITIWVEKYHLPVRWTPLRLVAVPPPCSPPVDKAFHRRQTFAVAHRVALPLHHVAVTPSNFPSTTGVTATPLDTYSPRQGSSSSPAAHTVRSN